MSEHNPARRRNVVMSIVETMRGSDVAVVERKGMRSQERAVVAIGDGKDAKDDQEQGERIQSGDEPRWCDMGKFRRDARIAGVQAVYEFWARKRNAGRAWALPAWVRCEPT